MGWRQLMVVSVLTAASVAAAWSTPPPPVPPPPLGVCADFNGDAAPERTGLEHQGAVGASQIWATRGRFACSEPAFGDTVDCFAGPGLTQVRIETGSVVQGFVLNAQEALRISPEGVTCSAPPDGPGVPVGHEPAPDMNDVHAAISAEAQRLYGAECGELRVPERAIEAVELTGAGHPEFAVFFSRVQCSGDGGATTRWSGTGGAMVQFWLASGGPPRLLLEHSMLGFSPADDFAGLVTHQHGGYCPHGAGPNICGIHSKRWTREQAIASMLNATGSGHSNIVTEIERYCLWPGQACAYMVGRQAINRMRDSARQAFGANFDIKGFHDILLTNGEVPLSVSETLVNQWVGLASQLGQN